MDGVTVGRLVQSFGAPDGVDEVTATTLAIANWDASKSESRYQRFFNSERWEVVIPEIIVTTGQ